MRPKLILGTAFVFLTMAASAASFTGRSADQTYPWLKSVAAAPKALSTAGSAGDIDLRPAPTGSDCVRARRTLWVDGQGWVVRRAGACQPKV